MSLKYIWSQGELILRLQHARNGAQIGKKSLWMGKAVSFGGQGNHVQQA